MHHRISMKQCHNVSQKHCHNVSQKLGRTPKQAAPLHLSSQRGLLTPSLRPVSSVWGFPSVMMATLPLLTPSCATAPSSTPFSRSPSPLKNPRRLTPSTTSLGGRVFGAQLSGREGPPPAALSRPSPTSSEESSVPDLWGPKPTGTVGPFPGKLLSHRLRH